MTKLTANWNKTLEWLDSLDFVCLADINHSSVTDFVDLVLPVCSKFECADSVGGIKCANAHILANLKVLDPLFESKSDFYIEKGIAEAMGLGALFPADGAEYARALLTTDDPQMAGFTLEKLQEAGGALRLIGSEDLIAPEVGFTYGTASGRQEPYYEALLEFGQAFPAWEAPCEAYPENPLREKYPLQFNQARSRFRVHSAYSGAKWIQEVAEPHIELNPVDAATRGLEDGDVVEVFNDRGSFRTVLRVNEAVRPESAFMVESTYRCKRSIMSKWAHNIGETFDWWVEANPDLYYAETTRSAIPDESADNFIIPIFYPLPEHYDWKQERFPCYPTSVEFKPDQHVTVEANMQKAIDTGNVQTFYGCFVEKLIMDNGRCVRHSHN